VCADVFRQLLLSLLNLFKKHKNTSPVSGGQDDERKKKKTPNAFAVAAA